MRLIDADALKKDWHMGDVCETCSRSTRQCGNDYCFSRMDVCGMIDDAPTVMGWVSVRDRLPEIIPPWNQEYVLVAFYLEMDDGQKVKTDSAVIGKYNPFEKTWFIYGIVDDVKERIRITHWMPLPEPPKEGEVG